MKTTLKLHTLRPLLAIPSRRSWGESWWTARDICWPNEPELPDPLQAVADRFYERLMHSFFVGDVHQLAATLVSDDTALD